MLKNVTLLAINTKEILELSSWAKSVFLEWIIFRWKKYFTWIPALAIVCMNTCGKTWIFLSRMIFLVHYVSNTMQLVSCTVHCVKFLRLFLRFKVEKIIYPKLLKTWNKFKMMNILFFQFLKLYKGWQVRPNQLNSSFFKAIYEPSNFKTIPPKFCV